DIFKEKAFLDGLDYLCQGICFLDSQLRIVLCNNRYLEMFDFPRDLCRPGANYEDVIRLALDQDKVPVNEIDKYLAMRLGQLRSSISYTHERIRPDGSIIEIKGNPLPGNCSFITFTDITSTKYEEAAKFLSKQRQALHFRQTPLAVIEWDLNYRVSEWNPAAENMFGHTKENALGRHAGELIVPKSKSAEVDKIWENLIKSRHGKRGTHENISKDGKTIICEWYSTPLENSNGEIIGIASLVQDITQRKKAEETIWLQANFDSLTDLPNRMVFFDRLEMAQKQADRNERMVGLLFLDLDYFKDVNDSEGHSMGDVLLVEVAKRLRKSIRKMDTVARLGGDEFAIIQTMISHVDDTKVLAEKILASLEEPFDLGNKKIFIGASIGITIFPIDDQSPNELLRNADIAMYAAKDKGRNTYEYYAAEMVKAIQERNMMVQDLHQAMEKRELFLHYQPKVLTGSGEIIGVEALLRWKHPKHGMISPTDFIPIAEKSGLIVPLGEWILKTACAENKSWQDAGASPISVAVNLSAVQFRQGDIVTTVAQALKETGLAPQYLELEITESAAMQDASETAVILDRLSELGVILSLDDFGTGYSSLAYLKRFPLSRIKIDRSFVQDIQDDPESAAIVNAVVHLGQSMNMKVTAEGVETKEQADYLSTTGCDEIQGYLYSKPVSADNLLNMIMGKSPRKITI
ncbi:MAG: EAL domain-containing protein, partial [Rhodospirillales bacterium]|nr:EAL domain-containing protein [Rhodospirillales bacterium]